MRLSNNEFIDNIENIGMEVNTTHQFQILNKIIHVIHNIEVVLYVKSSQFSNLVAVQHGNKIENMLINY